MAKDFSNKNLQKASFVNEDLSYASFANSDLRGADFSGADLTGANFTQVRTGITPLNTILIFIGALIVSLISGYFAMLAGHTIHEMLASKDPNIRIAGIATIVIIILFIAYSLWKGTGRAIENLILPAVLLAIFIALIYIVFHLGTGYGVLYQLFALFFVVIMFVIGTIARATANTLSVILFIIVALSGGMFGKSVGGGVGSVVMALACAQISKRALSGAKGFRRLRKIAFYVTKKLGTSFRAAKLSNVDLSNAKIHNADFSGVDVSSITWGDARPVNSIIGEQRFFLKPEIHG